MTNGKLEDREAIVDEKPLSSKCLSQSGVASRMIPSQVVVVVSVATALHLQRVNLDGDVEETDFHSHGVDHEVVENVHDESVVVLDEVEDCADCIVDVHQLFLAYTC